MSQPTPPGGQDPLLSSLDELVRSGRLSPDAARAALVAANGGGGTPDPATTQTTQAAPAAPAAPGSPGSTPGSPAGRAEGGAPVDAAEAKRLRMILPFDAVLVALGSALLFAVALIASSYARAGSLDLDPTALLGGAPAGGGGDTGLDVSIWLLGLLATLALIGVAVAGHLLGGDRARTTTLIGWPAAFAALALPSLIVVLFDLDGSGGSYLAGVLILLLGAGGYVLLRQPANLLVTILGLLLLYGQLVDDIFDVGDGDHPFLWVAIAVTFFVVAISVAGLVVEPRGFAGAVVGWISVLTHAGVLLGVVIAGFVGAFTAGFSGEEPTEPPSYDADVYVVLVLSVLLVLFWAVCYLLTENASYRILVLAMVATVLPLAIVAVGSDSPSLWQVVGGLLGLGALGFALLRTLQANPRTPSAGRRSASPSGPPSGSPAGPTYGGPSGPPPVGPPPGTGGAPQGYPQQGYGQGPTGPQPQRPPMPPPVL